MVVVPQCYQPTIIQRDIYVTYASVFYQQRREWVVVVPRCYQPTIIQREISVTLRLCILSTEVRVGGGFPRCYQPTIIQIEHLCNVTFMYFINRGESWWWLSRHVISLP